MSAIRIIDRVFFLMDEEENLISRQHGCTLLVSLKSGAARGSFNLEIRQEKPSGEQSSMLSAPVLLEGEDRGANIIVNMAFEPDQQGLYWFDVIFEGDLLTRVPLRAVYQKAPQVPRAE